jgi:hemoglobin-like flavoprotein
MPAPQIEESFEFIDALTGKRFGERFYERMFEQYPELKETFTGVIMAHQGALLMAALRTVVATYRQPTKSVEEYLRVIGHRHFQRGIEAVDYEKFQNALLDTLAECLGEKWHPLLEQQWRTALQKATDNMLRGHRSGQVIY